MDPLFVSLAALALASSNASSGAVKTSSDQAQTSTPDTAQEPDDDPLAHFYDILWTRKYADALSYASKFKPDNPQGEALVDAMRASALIGLKRDAEARHLIAEANRLAPALAESSWIIFYGGIVSDRMEFAADALDRLIEQAPDLVRTISTDNMDFFFQEQPTSDPKRNQDRMIKLARIGYGGATPTGRYIAGKAVDLLVRRSDFSEAEALLPYIVDPLAVENVLIMRRYTPLWPRMAELAGPHLELVRKASVDAAQRVYDEAPDNHENLQSLLYALRDAERQSDAIAYRVKLPHNQSTFSAADEDMGWAINSLALALHSVGRADEADRLFADLNEAPMPHEDWRVSMKLNRLELLVEDGKFERALPLIEPTAETKGTPYADQLARYYRYCTLRRLGRTEEAAKHFSDMMAHAGDAVVATMDGLLCAGEIDKAEALALAQLKNPDEDKRLNFEKDFVRRLQARPLTGDDPPTVWNDRWHELRQRPAIAAEFNRLGRDIPEAFLHPAPDAAK